MKIQLICQHRQYLNNDNWIGLYFIFFLRHAALQVSWKEEASVFFPLWRGERKQEGRGPQTLKEPLPTLVGSVFHCYFQCSVSLDKSSFQIWGSRSDVSGVCLLWCLIHFICNFWLKALFVKEASPRCLHAILCPSELWLWCGCTWPQECARSTCSSQSGMYTVSSAVHHIGSQSMWLLPQVQ